MIVKDDNLPRNTRHLGRILEAPADGEGEDDGCVHTVKISIGNRELDQNGKRTHSPTVLECLMHTLCCSKSLRPGLSPPRSYLHNDVRSAICILYFSRK